MPIERVSGVVESAVQSANHIIEGPARDRGESRIRRGDGIAYYYLDTTTPYYYHGMTCID